MRLIPLAVVFGFGAALAAQQPAFDVVSIRPGQPNSETNPTSNAPQPGGGWLARNVLTFSLLVEATGLDQPGQIVGAPALGGGSRFGLPDWMFADRWNVEARASSEVPVAVSRKMLLTLMAERFALRYHAERRPMEVFALVRAGDDGRPRPGLKPATVDCASWAAAVARGEKAARPPNPAPDRPSCVIRVTRLTPDGLLLRWAGSGADGQQLVDLLDSYAIAANGRQPIPVVDRTGLDRFDLDLTFTPQAGPSVVASDAPEGKPLLDAMREQLGLRLEKRTEMMDVMVIDRIERPTPN